MGSKTYQYRASLAANLFLEDSSDHEDYIYPYGRTPSAKELEDYRVSMSDKAGLRHEVEVKGSQEIRQQQQPAESDVFYGVSNLSTSDSSFKSESEEDLADDEESDVEGTVRPKQGRTYQDLRRVLVEASQSLIVDLEHPKDSKHGIKNHEIKVKNMTNGWERDRYLFMMLSSISSRPLESLKPQFSEKPLFDDSDSDEDEAISGITFGMQRPRSKRSFKTTAFSMGEEGDDRDGDLFDSDTPIENEISTLQPPP